MRVSDLMMSTSFIANLESQKTKMKDLQQQLSTSKKINQPSDNPAGTTSLLKYNNDLNSNEVFKNNIASGISFANQTSTAMESLQTDTANILTTLTQAANTTNDMNLGNFADKLDQAITSMLDTVNSKFDGKYIFGGTDQSAAPYGYTTGGKFIEAKTDVSGKQIIKISSTITQKINISGTELFGTVIRGSGNLASSDPVGSTSSGQTKVYDASGKEYDLITTYTKTVANTYDLTYDIKDNGGNSVFPTPPPAKSIEFDNNGEIKSIDGSSKTVFNIGIPSSNISFNFDASSLTEKNNAMSLTFSANQKNNIFNTLISIRDALKAGNKPSQAQMDEVSAFNGHLLDKLAENGNVTNQLSDMNDLIDNQKLEVKKLISNLQDVDVAQASIDLQNQNYMLQLSYKISSMILPQSLLNYL